MIDQSLNRLVDAAYALATPDVAPEKVDEANVIVSELCQRLATQGDSLDTATLTRLSKLKMPVHDLVFSENYGEWVRSGYPTKQLAGYLAHLAKDLLARRHAGYGTAARLHIWVEFRDVGFLGWLKVRRSRREVEARMSTTHGGKYIDRLRHLRSGRHFWVYLATLPYENTVDLDNRVEELLEVFRAETLGALRSAREVGLIVHGQEIATNRSWR